MKISDEWKNRLKRLLKLRFCVLYLLGLWAIFSSYSTDDSIMLSGYFILAGLAIRSWANCYAIKLDKLTTCGPYAHVRHPLYLGSFLILLGFFIMLQVNVLVTIVCLGVIIGIIYRRTISKEEHMLEDKFGQEYLNYKKKVPAFFPTLFAYKSDEAWGPSIKRYFRSQEYKLVLWVVILIIAFHLKEEFLIEHESVDIKIIVLIVVSVVFGLADLIGEYFRNKLKKTRTG